MRKGQHSKIDEFVPVFASDEAAPPIAYEDWIVIGGISFVKELRHLS